MPANETLVRTSPYSTKNASSPATKPWFSARVPPLPRSCFSSAMRTAGLPSCLRANSRIWPACECTLTRTSVIPADEQFSSQIRSRGTPWIGSRHLGTVSVRGRSRVPLPAARINAFMTILRLAGGLSGGKRLFGNANKSPLRRAVLILVDEWIVHQNSRAAEIEGKTHFANPLTGKHFAHCRLLVFVAVQQQETAAACPCNLPANGALFASEGVHPIDGSGGDLIGDFLLTLPSFVQKKPESMQVSLFQRLAHLAGEFADPVQRLDRHLIASLGRDFLLLQNGPGMVRGPGKKKHELAL